MSRRIDVELTSHRDDGTWTWRAAGARVPKGVVKEDLIPEGASVGEVLRVEIESFIDGISILAVLPPKSARAAAPRIELVVREPERLVTSTVTARGRSDRGDRPDRGERRGRPDGDRRNRPEGARGERRPGGGPREGGGAREGGGERRPPRTPVEPKPKAKRLRPLRTHRRDLVAALPEEQRPIAEELLRGGVPGVRTALEAQNAEAVAEGKPEINPEPLLALAEELWPRMRAAEWRDRAEAAIKEIDELDLRDLRSVVVAADSGARDDETREMAAQLRDALTRRVDEEHTKWLTELAELVADGRVVAALRRSSRPPKAGAPLPSDLARLLVDKTSEALNAEAGVERWAVLLDALSYSPVRSAVEPASVPEEPSDELVGTVRKVAGRLPAIAARFGIEAAPPPAPGGRGARRGRTRPERGAGGGGDTDRRPIPPPDALPTVSADADASEPETSELSTDELSTDESTTDESTTDESTTDESSTGEAAAEAPASAEGTEIVADVEIVAETSDDTGDEGSSEAAAAEVGEVEDNVGAEDSAVVDDTAVVDDSAEASDESSEPAGADA